jgi:hypothetical protein
MNGSVFKRRPCTEKRGSTDGTRTCKKSHGSRYYVHDLPGTARRQAKRGGYATKTDAETALARSMARCGQRGVAAERDMKAGRQTVAAYLQMWIDGKAGLKASTRRTYRIHIDNHLIPHLGDLRLDELSTAHIEAAYEQMRAPGVRLPAPEGPHHGRLGPGHYFPPAEANGRVADARGRLRAEVRPARPRALKHHHHRQALPPHHQAPGQEALGPGGTARPPQAAAAR